MIFCHLAGMTIIFAFRSYLSWENKRRDRNAAALGQEQPDPNQTAFQDLTDWENPNFRYVY